ncbi:cardiolipin synthase [Rossellomorea aquimaris]|uniref:Cardiolipin synthase n=1 Tax=Rossellomorea aquimaris TaxID=189382 RepID=A0A5D4U5R6_9BACI|nr:cardiolipin synthase [Rossellomorea aquimaris]TYS76242.1 cardiolipin synthase [Rossellomorea aquimaris]TYS82677.1 cardiolipin synthase [Rossellomorea aquimaris]
MWWFILLLIIVVVIGLLMIDFKLGRSHFIRTRTRRDYEKRNSDIELFSRGPELFDRMFKEMKEAKSSIHVLFYIVQDDHFALRFMDLLKDKAKEGVEVRLLMDQIGSHNVPKSKVRLLRDAGVEVAFCQKVRLPFLFFSSQQRNHRKITVIDGKFGYLGGYNVGKEYIDENDKPELSPWRDYHLRLEGEGVHDLQTEFCIDWFRAAKNELKDEVKYFPPAERGSITHQIFPTEGVNIEDFFKKFIDEAQDEIIIGTPYFIPTPILMDALCHALERDVIVRVIIPNNADHMLVKEAAFPYLRILLSKGAKVYQFMNGFYHAKVMIIDDHFCDLGTANFDKRSFFINLEINNLIFDKEFIHTLKNEMAKDMEASDMLSENDLANVSLLTRIKERVASSISILL